MRKIINTLSFFFFCAQITAQNAAWRNLYIPNIPISTPIWDIVFDKDTNFYVTTDTSLFRYNGGVWSNITPPLSTTEKLRYLAIDNQGGLWVSLYYIKGVFRRYNNVWQKYDYTNSLLPSDNIFFMKFDSLSKQLLIGTDFGVGIFNNSTNVFTKIGLPPDYTVNVFTARSLAINKTGEWYLVDFWLTTPIRIYKPQTGIWGSIPQYYYHDPKIGFDLNNNLYVLSMSSLIGRYDTTTQSWKNLPFVKNLDNGIAFDFTVDKKNKMWYFSRANGIMRFDSLNSTKYTKNNSPLYSDTINKIIVSPTNLKYIVGQGGGIQILDDALLISTKEESPQTAKIISSYNNPIQERLVLNLERNTSTQLRVQIHDLTGKLLYQNVQEIKQGIVEVNTAAFASGLYFVTCSDERHTLKETIKVVKY